MTRSVRNLEERVERVDGRIGDGDAVVYWMQQAQRTESNPALEHAIGVANEHDLPLAVLFCLVPDYPDGSSRHFTFLLEGLAEVEASLERRNISFEALVGSPDTVIGALAHRMAVLVTDCGHLPHERAWRAAVIDTVDCPVDLVDADVVVPVAIASTKLETAARTIRPKIHEHLDRFLTELPTTAVDRHSSPGSEHAVSLARTAAELQRIRFDDIAATIRSLGIADAPGPVDGWTGGTAEAKAHLRHFCRNVLPDYDDLRNRYDLDDSSSKLSPYLHFGQISPVDVVLAARSSDAPTDHVDSFVEEVVVRRELSVNFVANAESIDSFAALPGWASETLRTHADDERPSVYTAEELELGETDDEVWNAIMAVIRDEGWVHNQLRMYWGKQILYWTNTPEHAFRTLLDLNNRYFLDGRDPNSYANVAWCFGRHDQGFQERDVIGKVRPFTDKALKRKGDLDGWLESVR